MTKTKMHQLSLRNYKAQLRRGTINEETQTSDFLRKAREELNELYNSIKSRNDDPDWLEVADNVLVQFALAENQGIDLMKIIEEKVKYNALRND